MSSPAQTSDKVAVPFTEIQMNAIHSLILSELQRVRALRDADGADFVQTYILGEVADLTKIESDFRNFWRNALTADELGGE